MRRISDFILAKSSYSKDEQMKRFLSLLSRFTDKFKPRTSSISIKIVQFGYFYYFYIFTSLLLGSLQLDHNCVSRTLFVVFEPQLILFFIGVVVVHISLFNKKKKR